jgi:hypothetical protein
VRRTAQPALLRSSRWYRQRPLYRVADIRALADDPLASALLAELAAGLPAG